MKVGFVEQFMPTVYFDTHPSLQNSSYNYVINRRRVSKGISAQSSVNNGNFRTPNPQHYDYNAQILRTGQYRRIRKDGTISGVNGVFSNPLGTETTPDASGALANNLCMERLYEKLRGSLDLSVDGFQSKQLKSMYNTWSAQARQLGHLLRRIKRHPVKEASDLWLQYVYGVKPTMASLHDAYQLALAPRKDFLKITASAKDMVKFSKSQNSPILSQVKERVDGQSTHRARVQILYNVAQDQLNALGSISSLNMVSIGYELMTFSFVVDWFIDFGGYLRSYESALLHQSDFISGYMTTTSRKIINYSCSGSVHTDLNGTESISYNGTYMFGSKRRSVLTGNPLPVFPPFSVKMGMNRTLSAAALLVQALPYGSHADDIMEEFQKTHSRGTRKQPASFGK